MGKSTLLLALRAALFERHSSKSQSIKALQPNHVLGAAPHVVVEFEMDDGLYRLEKRFLRRTMARLTTPKGHVIEGNEAETAVQKILHLEQDDTLPLDKGSPGHFGVMLIPQSQSFYQPSLAPTTRHTLEEAITAEIEQLGNQSEVDAILANVEMAALEIVDKRNKPKGRFKDVEARINELEREIEAFQRDRDDLEADVADLNDAERRLSALESGETEEDLKAEVDKLETIRAELVRLKEIEANIKAARYRLDHLQMTRDQRQKRQAELMTLAAERDRLIQEETAAREQLGALEAEFLEQQAKRRSLIGADEAIRQKRRAFEQLNEQLNQRAEIENALHAIATEVTIDLESSALNRVRLNGQPVERSTEVVQVVDGLEIDIEEVGRIRVLPKIDQLERLRDHRATLDRSIATHLETLQLESTAPGPLEVFWRDAEEEAGTLAAHRAELEEIVRDLEALLGEKRPLVLTLATRRQQVEARFKAVNDEIKADGSDNDPTEEQLAAAKDEFDAARKSKEALRQADQPAPMVLDQLEARIKSLRLRLETRARTINEAKIAIGRLSAKVAVRAGRGLDERLEDCYRRRDILTREQQCFKLDAGAFSLLKSTLIEAANDAKAQFQAPLAAKLTPYIQALLPDAEAEVTADFGVAALHRGNPVGERFEQLSDGTREQIAILARLAFARMLQEQGLPALVVLDDALVFSDERRLARMFEIVENAAQNLQIVILTCHEERFATLQAKHLRIVPQADAA